MNKNDFQEWGEFSITLIFVFLVAGFALWSIIYALLKSLPYDVEAVKWYRKAAEQGYEPAKQVLENFEQQK